MNVLTTVGGMLLIYMAMQLASGPLFVAGLAVGLAQIVTAFIRELELV